MTVFIVADPGACWKVPGEPDEASLRRLSLLIIAAKEAGANAIKWQYYEADAMYPQGSAEHALLRPYELPREWLPLLKKWCAQERITFACTVYDATHVPLISRLVPWYKVSSFDLPNAPLLERLGKSRKPLVMSTGMASTRQVQEALSDWDWEGDRNDITLLHCVSSYPARAEQMNLRAMVSMADELGELPYGLSDHTTGTTAAVAAVALGATFVEHHLRADDTPPSNPDYPHSASPAELKDYVAAVREAELMLGDGVKRIMSGEETAWRWNAKTGRRGVKA